MSYDKSAILLDQNLKGADIEDVLLQCMLEPRSTDSLGTQHCAKFESNTNRMTFEYAPNMMIVKVHHLYLLI